MAVVGFRRFVYTPRVRPIGIVGRREVRRCIGGRFRRRLGLRQMAHSENEAGRQYGAEEKQ